MSNEGGAESENKEERLVDQLGKDPDNWFDAINRQTQEIDDEIKRQQPLVSSKEPIENLSKLYNDKESTEFFEKAKMLREIYGGFRRIRGDGNCFYRALLFAQLESLFIDDDERETFTNLCKNWRPRLLKLGFPDFTTNDFCDWFDELLDDISTGKRNMQSVFESLNSDGSSNYYVTFFRIVTSGFLRENAALYEGFVDGGRTIENFCREEIEPMWKECDHLAIIALTNALKVSIRIEYMDRTRAPNGGWHYDFIVDEKPPRLFFLYRPGHYDVLYRKKQQVA